MSDMVGKMSVQAKIAELESRIAALEKRSRSTTTTTTTTTIEATGVFDGHWDKMWEEFNHVMKNAFSWRRP